MHGGEAVGGARAAAGVRRQRKSGGANRPGGSLGERSGMDGDPSHSPPTVSTASARRSLRRLTPPGQYSFLMTKYEPRIVPASFDFSRANLERGSSSGRMSIPSDSLKPTARFSGPSTVYITFTDRPPT